MPVRQPLFLPPSLPPTLKKNSISIAHTLLFSSPSFYLCSLPQTFVFVKDGEVKGRLVGANPDKLREAVFRFL